MSAFRSFAIMCLLVTLAVMTPASAESSDGSDGPGDDERESTTSPLSIVLSPEEAQAFPKHNAFDNVTFTGTVEVDQNMTVTSIVHLEAITNVGWKVFLDPVVLQFTGPGSDTFTATVTVPSKTLATARATLIVNATLDSYGRPSVEASAAALVTVGPYYRVTIQSASPLIALAQGDQDEIWVEVINTGNAMTVMRFGVPEVPEGVTIALDRGQAEVPPGGSVNVSMVVTSGTFVPGGTNSVGFNVEAVPSEGPAQSMGTFNTTVHVESMVESYQELIWLLVGVVTVTIIVLYFMLRRRREMTNPLAT